MESIIISMETIANPASSSPSKLESHLGYWLRRVSNAVSGEFARALQLEQASVAEWVLLRELYERDQATAGELASTLGCTRGAISKIVDKLEEKRWIQCETSHDDQRVRKLSLTRKGRGTLPCLARAADQNDKHFFACLDGKERSTLRTLLIKLADHHQMRDVPTE
jgi:DNA-binding MarR family transcriptional regulator